MTAGVKFTMHGLKQSAARYGKRIRKVRNLLPAWRKVDAYLITPMFRRQFATKGAYGGQAWAGLRPTTQKARQRSGGNRGGIGHPLWDFGRLKGSLEAVGPESIRVMQPHKYQRGTRVPYAHLHQTGFTVTQWGGRQFKRPRRVPARPPIPDPIPKHTTRTAVRFVGEHITEV